MLRDQHPSLIASLRAQHRTFTRAVRTTACKCADGQVVRKVQTHMSVNNEHRDKYPTEPLPSAWVEEALQDDVN